MARPVRARPAVSGCLNDLSTRRYDGQMLMEDKDTGAGKLTRYGLGARGIDYMALTTTQGTSEGYPVYDAHGNMVATLAKSGGGYQVSDRRAYDAWGGIRQGNTTGEPKGRSCASLGHVQDDESGLVYMRARYNEPGSGRFISEDPGMDGPNWYAYGSNCPTLNEDYSGRRSVWADAFLCLLGLWLVKTGIAMIKGGVADYLEGAAALRAADAAKEV